MEDSSEKPLLLGKAEGKRRRGRQDEMVGCYHHLDGQAFEQAPRVGDGPGSLVCCKSMGSQTVGHDRATEKQ